ncbi:uncharacterized protein AMSG_11931 [Thecamonas trahens ATCC 50062]|uniref:Tudor domain-containing protein n=1 Tax=Thecamonas trahens ATCC 50062 TaxID=461836 RepID=A0A0L0DBL2_THETB|nr:hypothetical protein AMSG_11931 [Thecamonas trahens ATCC 50062]KNC49727.1 hypothetical protein AMSG_11931 [Thecamonas trahens ATCC 50062]|eukprot:XP_013757611.1 hypothetical protein AMSG_11931 [Thecamonas trahens ATCC 50062]
MTSATARSYGLAVRRISFYLYLVNAVGVAVHAPRIFTTNLTFWLMVTHVLYLELPLLHPDHRAAGYPMYRALVVGMHGASFAGAWMVAVLATLLVFVYDPHFLARKAADMGVSLTAAYLATAWVHWVPPVVLSLDLWLSIHPLAAAHGHIAMYSLPRTGRKFPRRLPWSPRRVAAVAWFAAAPLAIGSVWMLTGHSLVATYGAPANYWTSSIIAGVVTVAAATAIATHRLRHPPPIAAASDPPALTDLRSHPGLNVASSGYFLLDNADDGPATDADTTDDTADYAHAALPPPGAVAAATTAASAASFLESCGLRPLLERLTLAVATARPDDVLAFAASALAEELRARDGHVHAVDRPVPAPRVELTPSPPRHELLEALPKAADASIQAQAEANARAEAKANARSEAEAEAAAIAAARAKAKAAAEARAKAKADAEAEAAALAAARAAAATKIQASYRGHVVRKARRVRQADEAVAAIRIQAAYRGHAVRKACRVRKADEAVAATRIQAVYRGHAVRAWRTSTLGALADLVTDLNFADTDACSDEYVHLLLDAGLRKTPDVASGLDFPLPPSHVAAFLATLMPAPYLPVFEARVRPAVQADLAEKAAAAARIQAVFRAKRERTAASRAAQASARAAAQRSKAVYVLQATLRGNARRKALLDSELDPSETNPEPADLPQAPRITSAATTLQAQLRGNSLRHELLDDDASARAATAQLFQAHLRGNARRSKLLDDRDALSSDSLDSAGSDCGVDAETAVVVSADVFVPGDRVLAVYDGDGLLYPAEVVATYANEQVITVVFDGYDDEDDVELANVQPLDE